MFEEDVDDVIPLAVKGTVKQVKLKSNYMVGYSEENILQLQRKDHDIRTLYFWVSNNQVPEEYELKLSSPTIRHFWINRDRLLVENGILYYKWEEVWATRLLLMVPSLMRQEIMHGNHDLRSAGHLGIKKTIEKVRQSFMWYGLTTDVDIYVKSCDVCNRNKKANVKA